MVSASWSRVTKCNLSLCSDSTKCSRLPREDSVLTGPVPVVGILFRNNYSGHELLSFLFHYVHKNLSTLDPASTVFSLGSSKTCLRLPHRHGSNANCFLDKTKTTLVSGLCFVCRCGPEKIRTPCLLSANEALYQVSYGPR